jgi:geranylgeranyl pyrophosphate synthase
MTYVALYGIERARREADKLVTDATAALHGLPGPVEPLAAIAHFIVERKS